MHYCDVLRRDVMRTFSKVDMGTFAQSGEGTFCTVKVLSTVFPGSAFADARTNNAMYN